MSTEKAVEVISVYKDFVLPHEKSNSIKRSFINVLTGKTKGGSSKQHALKDISVEVQKGEFFGIVGRNGSGKSTLLKIIAGIYQPSRGKVNVSGRLVPFIELGVGFNPELTGRQNVFLNGALMGFSKKEVEAMYDDIVDFAELSRFMDQKLKNYSSGMQVRLAFSMATRSKADILLIDEVLAVGDADFQRKCFNYFSDLKKQHTTVVFVTHDMSAVLEYCDRAMLIEKNKVQIIGSPSDVSREYLRLFSTPSSGAQPKEGEKQWGDGHATVENFAVKLDKKTNMLNVSVRAKYKIDMESPVVGIVVKNSANQHLFGTNTKVEGLDLGSIKAGKVLHVNFSFPNILSAGTVFFDVALQHADAVTVCDWREDVANIEIESDRLRTPYSITPEFNVSVK